MRTTNIIRNDQAAGLRRAVNNRPVKVITVTSGKGGVGKTNISANLSVTMANAGKRVLLLDADLGLANVDVLLGLQPRYNLSHVVNGQKSLEGILLDGPSGIKIIPASSGLREMVELSHKEHAGVIRAFSDLQFKPDILVVDTAAGISDSVISFSRASHEVLVVVCDEPASITDAYALIKLLNKEYGQHRFRIITNMVNSAQEGVELYKKLVKVATKFLDVTLDYIGAIPYDEYFKKAVQRQKPVVTAYPRSKSSLAFGKSAQKIDQWPLPDGPSGHIEFFVERLFSHSKKTGMAFTL